MASNITYSLLIGFGASQQTGNFILDTSTMDSAAGMGFGFIQGSIDVSYADYTSISTRISYTRGRDDDITNMTSGRIEIDVSDVPGNFNPKNAASPLYGLIRPLRPCIVTGTVAGVTYGIFYGYLNEEQSYIDWSQKSAHLMFQDMLIWLDRSYPIIGSTGPTTVDAAIALVLNYAQWPTNQRILQVGGSIPDFSADGTISGLAVIQNLLAADQGVFFADSLGNAVYLNRYYQEKATTAITLSSFQSSVPGVALSRVKNKARVTRTGGVMQEWSDAASILEFAEALWPEVTSPYFNADSDALALAQWLVARGKSPVSNLWSVDLQDVSPTDAANMLNAELLDLVTIPGPDIAGNYFIQKITGEGGNGTLHKASLVLSDPYAVNALVMDTTTFDNGIFAY